MRVLPERPDLDQLRRQARELLRAAAAGDHMALNRLRVVSDRVTLSVAQLALAHEYCFASWAALRAEVRRRRELHPDPIPPRDPPEFEDRWSFGGAGAIEIAAGTLRPSALVVGVAAVMDATLTPADQQTALPLDFFCAMRTVSTPRAAGLEDLTVLDDRGTGYTFHYASIFSSAHRPVRLRLRIEPTPPCGCAWIELRNQHGDTTRLLPSPHRTARVGSPVPTTDSPAAEPPQVTDGQCAHLDLTVALPPIDGTVTRIDHLVADPESWRLHLRARPGWWTYREDFQRKWATLTVRATDDLGGRYLDTFDGSTGHGDHEDLALRFRPGLDPLARTITLTFSGKHEQVGVELDLR